MIMYTREPWGCGFGEKVDFYKRCAVKNTLMPRLDMERFLFRMTKEAVRVLTHANLSKEYRDNIVRGDYIFSPSYILGPIEFDPNCGVYIPGVEPGTWWFSREYDWIKFKVTFESKAMKRFRNLIISEYPEVIPDIENSELKEVIAFEFGKDDV